MTKEDERVAVQLFCLEGGAIYLYGILMGGSDLHYRDLLYLTRTDVADRK